ncbi:MAG: SufE family protein [Bdellovibrionaceae bacterium]|nr:SufE family protein [Bdellovibrio sp.]
MPNDASILSKIESLKKQFAACTTWEKKYEKIIELGKHWPGLTDDLKVEDLKVKGCQSQVWIKAEMTPEKKVVFKGDSDALLVKGLVALVLTVYSNEAPDTILKTEPNFLKDIGFDSGLSPSRSNGLYSMIKQIKYYATAFQYLLSK